MKTVSLTDPTFYLFLTPKQSQKWLLCVASPETKKPVTGLLEGENVLNALEIIKSMIPEGGTYNLVMSERDETFISETFPTLNVYPFDKQITINIAVASDTFCSHFLAQFTNSFTSYKTTLEGIEKQLSQNKENNMYVVSAADTSATSLQHWTNAYHIFKTHHIILPFPLFLLLTITISI
jgi:hypothetical protein